jgi:type II secretory pathway component PulM
MPSVTAPFALLARHYRQRPPRERRLLAAGLLIVGAAALFSLLDWSWRSRQRLAEAAPHRLAQLEQMRRDSAELARLQTPAPPQATVTAEELRSAAAAQGLSFDIRTVGAGYELSGKADGEHLLEWLAGVHGRWHLRPDHVALTREARRVRFEILLVPARNAST